MKKVFSLILTITFLLCLCACDSPVLPPVRDPENYAEIDYLYSDFEDMCARSDAVALIEIGDWLGEDDENTYFEATIIKQYTGEKLSKIRLAQPGNSKQKLGYTLFAYGNKMLIPLFLFESAPYENTYMVSAPYSVLFAEEIDGNYYVISRYDHYLEKFNLKTDTAYYKEVIDKIIENDPYYKDSYLTGYIYKEKDIETLIKSFSAER